MGRPVRLTRARPFSDLKWGDAVDQPPIDSGWVDRYQVHNSMSGYPQTGLNAIPETGRTRQVPELVENFHGGGRGGGGRRRRRRRGRRGRGYRPVGDWYRRLMPRWYPGDYEYDDDDDGDSNLNSMITMIITLLFLNLLLLFFIFLGKS